MKQIRLGRSFGVSQLETVECDRPSPGPDQVLIRVRAVSLNYRDWEVINGEYHDVYGPGLVPMSDGAGEIVEIGEQVKDLQAGDRVVGSFWQGWYAGPLSAARGATTLGGPADGMLAEYVCLPASGVVAIPELLSFEEASTLPCAAVTAWHSLVAEGGLRAGEWVLVQGTGGVSIFALQFARLHGARTLVLSSSDAKLARASELGAECTLNYVSEPDWSDKVREMTGGIDHVLEVGGPGTFSKSLGAIRPGGQINVIGYLGGKGGEMNPLQILQSHARIRGIAVGPKESLRGVCRSMESGRCQPIVDATYDWMDYKAAFEQLRAGKHFGKLVLQIG